MMPQTDWNRVFDDKGSSSIVSKSCLHLQKLWACRFGRNLNGLVMPLLVIILVYECLVCLKD